MKTYKISILSLLLALLFLAGCSDRKKFFEDERYEKMVYIVSDNNNIHNLIYDLDGYRNNVVVLTRNRGYRKENKDIRVPSFVYRKYPKIREALSRRCAVYNEQLEMVERMEEEGNITVIRPRKPVVVDRIERDIHKLTDLYEEGYECAKQQFENGGGGNATIKWEK